MRVYNRLEVRLLLPKPFSIAELLETVRVVLCATAVPARSSSHCQTGEASRRLMVYGGDDSTSRSRVQLTIDYPTRSAGFFRLQLQPAACASAARKERRIRRHRRWGEHPIVPARFFGLFSFHGQ